MIWLKIVNDFLTLILFYAWKLTSINAINRIVIQKCIRIFKNIL